MQVQLRMQLNISWFWKKALILPAKLVRFIHSQLWIHIWHSCTWYNQLDLVLTRINIIRVTHLVRCLQFCLHSHWLIAKSLLTGKLNTNDIKISWIKFTYFSHKIKHKKSIEASYCIKHAVQNWINWKHWKRQPISGLLINVHNLKADKYVYILCLSETIQSKSWKSILSRAFLNQIV